MEERITMLKIEDVSKVYRLGEIGGTTLREELQRLGAKIRRKEDPTKKIGAKNFNKGESFKALDNLNLSIKKGERVGIIGHNGAGKSTLLKLISRVTAPTSGAIYLNGRVASMLEVGTGFHPELTGRENIYLNGAILGMTKKEIDRKIEQIIDFSEVSKFIDTPVKRYSSGMYVKLAFSVAAHLDSEIMIMDEVLAVGDMAFQNKCLKKMKSVSVESNRAVLYVSHNMSTIRQLCDRVIVLDHGKIIFDGDVEKGISVYLGQDKADEFSVIDTSSFSRGSWCTLDATIQSINLISKLEWKFSRGEKINFFINWKSDKYLKYVNFRCSCRTSNDLPVGTFTHILLNDVQPEQELKSKIELDTSLLHPGMYYFTIGLFQKDDANNIVALDTLSRVIHFEIINNLQKLDSNNSWTVENWGSIHFNGIEVKTDIE